MCDDSDYSDMDVRNRGFMDGLLMSLADGGALGGILLIVVFLIALPVFLANAGIRRGRRQ